MWPPNSDRANQCVSPDFELVLDVVGVAGMCVVALTRLGGPVPVRVSGVGERILREEAVRRIVLVARREVGARAVPDRDNWCVSPDFATAFRGWVALKSRLRVLPYSIGNGSEYKPTSVVFYR